MRAGERRAHGRRRAPARDRAANDRVEVRFPVAAERAGTARFQVGAASGRVGRRGRARAAGVDAGDDRGVRDLRRDRRGRGRAAGARARRGVPQFGGLEVTTSSTALQALTDAVLYLVAYPFECAEQLASRVLAVAALRDVLGAFEAEDLPSPTALEAGRDARRRAAVRAAERRRRLRVLAAGRPSWPYLRSTSRTRWRGRRPRASRSRRTCSSARSATCARSTAHPARVRRRSPAHARQAYALSRPDAAGRRGQRAGARRSCARPAVEKLSFEALGWLLPLARPRRGVAGRGRGDPPPHREPVSRDRRRRALRGLLRRRRLPAAPLRPPRRRDPARGADRRPAEERPHPQARRGPARAPQGGPLGEHAGERLRAARARPLLRHLREGDARLRGARLAGRTLRGRRTRSAAARPSASHLDIPMAVLAGDARRPATS